MGKKSSSKDQPRTTQITPASVASTLTSFSSPAPAKFYAHLHRAPDAHTLRVFDFATGKCVSRWASEEGDKVAAVEWALLPAPAAAPAKSGDDGEEATKRGKKRRKSDSAVEEGTKAVVKDEEARPVLALGLEDGSIVLWAPTGSTAAPVKLVHPSASNNPVTALSAPSGEPGHLWSAHADGAVLVWDLAAEQLIGKLSGHVDPTAAGAGASRAWDDLAVRYGAESGEGKKCRRAVDVVLAKKSVRVFSVDLPVAGAKKDKVRDFKVVELAKCTGHVGETLVRFLHSAPAAASDSAMADDDEPAAPVSFLSFSPTDRFVQLWTIPSSSASASSPVSGTLLARLALDSPVQSIALSGTTLAAIDSDGKVSLGHLDLSPVEPKAKGVHAVKVETEIVGPIASVAFGTEGALSVCRAGVKPVFEVVNYVDENGIAVGKIEITKSAQTGLLHSSIDQIGGTAPPARYSEPLASTVRSGAALPTKATDADDDDEEEAEVVNSGALDVDMAEPTLADRLRALDVSKASALNGGGAPSDASSDGEGSSDDEDEEDDASGSESGGVGGGGKKVAATSLTTTLIQALHSSDAPLLESCLEHTNPGLIRTTVKRIPSGSLVLSLLEALVERLGKGKRGKEGSASVKRARGLIEWVRQTLVVHVGFLVTIPSLVTRLATLHSSLTSRLALQPTLLALNGRLELVMSQIELRQEKVSSSTAGRVSSAPERRKVEGKVYVEGESDSEGSEGESEGEEGSVEDVVLGSGEEEGDSDEEDSEEEDGEEDEEVGEDEDSFGPRVGRKSSARANGRGGVADLLELEASEGSEEESDEDSEEDGEESEEED